MPERTRTKRRSTNAPTKGPSEIAPGVFVGGWKDALDFAGARFCVLDEAPDDMPTATHVAIYREATDRASLPDLDRLVEGMRAAHAKGKPVLVFCGHGVRRSALGGAWYLRRAEGLSLDEAYDRVRSARPRIQHARQWVGNAADLDRA
ncbi:MAG TPA: dual specificity protein phosphatase family protein [Thermoplasmata archaeon]|nr:dual specificity protein phosphatase family protein [Thermoplasmata archaeon]HUI38362.1 dual specificity protein phosphatase family protein [Thermoplasmata archaeon]